jgi:ankyrin repeat protein
MAIAASSGQAELVQLLVGYGADPRALEGDGITPIELCRKGRQTAMANLLAELAARNAASAALQAAVAARD